MNELEFRGLVRKMRRAQRRWFDLKRTVDLIEAKDLEREVDVDLGEKRATIFEEGKRGRQL